MIFFRFHFEAVQDESDAFLTATSTTSWQRRSNKRHSNIDQTTLGRRLNKDQTSIKTKETKETVPNRSSILIRSNWSPRNVWRKEGTNRSVIFSAQKVRVWSCLGWRSKLWKDLEERREGTAILSKFKPFLGRNTTAKMKSFFICL